MKANGLTFLALALMTTATFLACAGGSETGMGGEGGTGGTGGSGGGAVTTTTTGTTTTGTTTTGTTTTGTTTTGTTTTGTTTTISGCVPQCASDADCQNSCPAVSTGANCCDTSIGICYVGTASVCPVPTDGGTGAAPPY